MITVAHDRIVETSLIDSLTDDLTEIAELAAQLTAPEAREAAEAAKRNWSPGRLARSLAEDLLEQAA